MDSNPLERERGITILAKNTSVRWGDVKINIVDTPGHADFGGEVERILRMVDGVLLLVDAAEGPMPQTRFVHAQGAGAGARSRSWSSTRSTGRTPSPSRVHDEVLELFIELEASDEQLDAPFLYASSRDGRVCDRCRPGRCPPTRPDAAVRGHRAPRPGAARRRRRAVPDAGVHARLLALPRAHRDRAHRARARCAWGSRWRCCRSAGRRWWPRSGSSRRRWPSCSPSRGCSGSRSTRRPPGTSWRSPGIEGVEIGKTLTDPDHAERLAGIAVEEPTISVDFIVNNSPFAGREGKFVTTRQLRERLFRELERNVALRVEETDTPDTFTVSGRGELHLSHPDGDDAARGLRVPGVPAAGHHAGGAGRRAARAVRGAGGRRARAV